MLNASRWGYLSVFYVLAALFAVSLFVSPAYSASCTSPGIPCTDYDVNTDTTAGTDAAINGPKTGLAAPHTGGSCDGNFMNQIYARAYMEASREVIINEQLIHKPDSVLEYTCFDQYIAMSAHFAGPIFSESDDFDNRSVDLETADDTQTTTYTVNYADTHLDDALDELLLDSLDNYITNNFSHTYLGGEATVDSSMNNTSIGGNSYSCSEMMTIWEIARCRDIGEDDQFISFEDIALEDPRTLIAECSPGMTPGAGSNTPMTISETDPCPAAGGGPFANTNVTNDIIRVANNCDFTFSVFDGVNLLYELMKAPGSSIGSGPAFTCADGIETGVMMNYRRYSLVNDPPPGDTAPVSMTYSTRPDMVCPNPGCFYDTSAGDCVPP